MASKKRKDPTSLSGSGKTLKKSETEKCIIDPEECGVCDETFNKSTCKKFLCSCGEKICIKCIQNYCFSKTLTEGKCMSCNRIYDREQLNKIFGSSLSKYNNHLKNILFNKQKLKFSLCFEEIKDIKKKNLYNDEYDRIQYKYEDLENKLLYKIDQLKGKKPKSPKIKTLKDEVNKITGRFLRYDTNKKYRDISNKLDNLKSNYSDNKDDIQSKIEETKKKIIKEETNLKSLSNHKDTNLPYYQFNLNFKNIRKIKFNISKLKKYIKDLQYILKCDSNTENILTKELEKLEILKDKYKCFLHNKIVSEICPIKFPKPSSIKIMKKKKPKKYIKHCSIEGCHGMLDETWVCALCKQKVCSKCFENIGDEYHECKEENVLSAKLIKSQTKPCPKCGAPVERASGCSQMMCMNPIGPNKTCNTIFDFNTGEIDNGVIHNPHFYQWRLESGNNDAILNGFQCGRRFPNFSQLKGRICICYELNTPEKRKDFTKNSPNFLQIMTKIYYYCVTFTNRLNNDIRCYYPTDFSRSIHRTNIRFLLQKLDINSYKTQLYKYHNGFKMNNEIYQIYDLFNKVFRENIIRFYVKPSKDNLFKIVNEIYKLRSYSNEQLMKISCIYKKKVGIISNKFNIIHDIFTKKKIEKQILASNVSSSE